MLTDWQAADEWTSSCSLWTHTNRVVVYHFALGSDSAGSSARIDAFLVTAGLVHGAIRVDHALGPASRRRPRVANRTGTDCMSADVATLAVRPARRRYTRIRRDSHRNGSAVHKRISLQSLGTRAHRDVVHDAADCVDGACAWTGIRALIPDARSVPRAVRVHDAFGPASRIGIAMIFRQT